MGKEIITQVQETQKVPNNINLRWNTPVQFSSVQSLSCVWLFATSWITARQASLSIINSRNSLRLTPIESVMPSSHLILCRPLLLLIPIPPSIRVFSNESTLRMRWPKHPKTYINQINKVQTQRTNIKSNKGKKTNNTHGDSLKDSSWSFNRNSSGEGMARHT